MHPYIGDAVLISRLTSFNAHCMNYSSLQYSVSPPIWSGLGDDINGSKGTVKSIRRRAEIERDTYESAV